MSEVLIYSYRLIQVALHGLLIPISLDKIMNQHHRQRNRCRVDLNRAIFSIFASGVLLPLNALHWTSGGGRPACAWMEIGHD